MISKRLLNQFLLSSVAALCLSSTASAQQNWPNRPIRLVVPFTPGGSTDILGRAIAQKLSESLGQPVTVDNVPSAGGSIGADKVAKSPADGYTLLMGHIGTLAVNPLILPKLAYNPVKDFAPEAYGRHIAKEIERWRPVVKAGNIQPS